MLTLNLIKKKNKQKKTLYVYTNNPEKSLTTKTGEHNACGYLISTIWAFDRIENKPISVRLYIAEKIV